MRIQEFRDQVLVSLKKEGVEVRTVRDHGSFWQVPAKDRPWPVSHFNVDKNGQRVFLRIRGSWQVHHVGRRIVLTGTMQQIDPLDDTTPESVDAPAEATGVQDVVRKILSYSGYGKVTSEV